MKLALVFSLVVLGCGRAHLEPAYGRSYHQQFALQQEHPPGSKRVRATTGLDAQEAAIIAGTYRHGLAPKEAQGTKEQPILVVAPTPPGTGTGKSTLMPSVPAYQ
ncbi:MAG TPA: hypothetical protein VFG53_16455 [Anaeromyxobacter sp.]|nr:hypothetical protein [Anaeromyxobacter sp.]